MAPQLKLHVEQSIASNDLIFPGDNVRYGEDISDIFDGEIYKNLRNKYADHKFITLTINTDGAKVFKSTSKGSLWPLQFYINEIDIKKRFRRSNIMIASIAYGESPDMTSFLKPFITEINDINTNGGLKICVNGSEEFVYVFPLLFTLDSVAKCEVLLKRQYNGYNGCPYCHHNGTLIPRNHVRYCREHNASLRTDENTRDAMLQAFQTGKGSKKPIRGYNGISPLYALPIDLVWQIPIEKMHNSDLGAMRKI